MSLAPGAYQNEKVNMKQSPSYSFGVKANNVKPSDTPGSKYYNNLEKQTFKNFAFLAPCAYETEKVKLDQSIAYSFGSKFTHDKPNSNPAPGAYEVEKVHLDHAPSYSFGSRLNHDKPSDTPGNFKRKMF